MNGEKRLFYGVGKSIC